MKKLLIALSVALSLGTVSGYAQGTKSQAQYIIETFDGLCIQNADDFANIEYMVKAIGGREMPPEFQQGDPAMRRMGGKSYSFKYDNIPYIVAYANGGGCTLITENIDRSNLSELLQKNLKAELKDTYSSGAQITEFYLINDDTNRKGAAISLVYGRDETGWTEGSISYLPPEIVKKALATSP